MLKGNFNKKTTLETIIAMLVFLFLLSRHIPTMEMIKEEVESWQNNRNNKNNKIDWQFTNKDARIKLKKLYPPLHD